MKKLKTLTAVLAATTLLLAGALVYVLVSDTEEYSWEYYNAATDRLFEELAKTNVTEPERSTLITGIVGIPWARGYGRHCGRQCWDAAEALSPGPAR